MYNEFLAQDGKENLLNGISLANTFGMEELRAPETIVSHQKFAKVVKGHGGHIDQLVLAYQTESKNDTYSVLFWSGRMDRLTSEDLYSRGINLGKADERHEKEYRAWKKKEADLLKKYDREMAINDRKNAEIELKRQEDAFEEDVKLNKKYFDKYPEELKREREKLAKRRKEQDERFQPKGPPTAQDVKKTADEPTKEAKSPSALPKAVSKDQAGKQVPSGEPNVERTQPPQKIGEVKGVIQPAAANLPKPSKGFPVTPGATTPNTKPDKQKGPAQVMVSLASPYPQSYPGASTNKISLQYAVMEILKQAGIEYNFKKSQENVGDLARRWITPNIVNQPYDAALKQILGPFGLSFEVADGKVVLKRN
jgi:hypothetical protein